VRMPRLTIRDYMVILAILALLSSVPIQYRTREQQYNRQFLVDQHAIAAEEISRMADVPAGWMDEFRPYLRRQAEAEREVSRQIARTGLSPPLDPVDTAEEVRFWTRFQPIAASHRYRPPRLQPTSLKPWTIADYFAIVWPALLAILLLPCIGPARRLATQLLSGRASTSARPGSTLGEA
jgi:hypothetical protein